MSLIWANRLEFLNGLRVTVQLTALSMGLSILVGALIAVAVELGPWPVRAVTLAYVEVFRAIPLLVVLYAVYLILPVVTNIALSSMTSAVVALTLNVSAFCSEAFRAGIAAVPRGQWQAGRALGMNTRAVLKRVVWPQAWRATIPIVGSIWVGLFKDSALVSLVQAHDLMFVGLTLANSTFQYLPIYTAVAVIYIVVSYPQARIVDWLNCRLRVEA
jgi:polar amino acid transport system permease protein